MPTMLADDEQQQGAPQNPDDVVTPQEAPQVGADLPLAPPSQQNQDISTQVITPGQVNALAPDPGAMSAAQRKLHAATDAASSIISRNADEIGQIGNQPVTHPDVPTLENVPAPPDEKPDPRKTMRVFGETLPVLAMLGGLFMHRDATAALNAGAAAIEAARNQDHEALQAAHQQWEDSVASINQRNQTRLQQYQAVLSDTKLTMDERQARLQALAAEDQNALQLQQLAQGDISGIAQGVQTWTAAAGTFASAVAAQARANASSAAASGTWSPEAIEMAAQGVADGAPPPTNTGRNGVVVGKIYSRAAEIRRARGDTNGAFAFDRASFTANAASLRQLTTQRTAILRAEDAARRNINLAESITDRLARAGSPIVNRWLLPGQHNLGDPEIAAANIAINRALDEYARVITGQYGAGGTPVTQLEEARRMLNSADNPETIHRAFAVIRSEMENVRRSFDDQQSELQSSMSGQGVRPLSDARRVGDRYFMNDGTVGIWRGDHFEAEH